MRYDEVVLAGDLIRLRAGMSGTVTKLPNTIYDIWLVNVR
jgi:hypothetical protein